MVRQLFAQYTLLDQQEKASEDAHQHFMLNEKLVVSEQRRKVKLASRDKKAAENREFQDVIGSSHLIRQPNFSKTP